MYPFHLLFSVVQPPPDFLADFSPSKSTFSPKSDWRTGKIRMIEYIAVYTPLAGESSPVTGTIHLYRGERAIVPEVDVDYTHEDYEPSPEKLLEMGHVVCVLAVPKWHTPQDFLKHMGAYRASASHLVVINDVVPNRYIILVKFRQTIDAWNFWKHFDSRPFNSFEPELCHVVFVSSILVNSRADDPNALLHVNMTGPLIKIPLEKGNFALENSKATLQLERSNLNTNLELPTCPVCLDRMDVSVTGLFSTVCHHTFHCSCIIKWGDSTCPVCRHSSAELVSSPAEEQQSICTACGSSENLWICLICAHVGCGRYVRKHAHAHYEETSHIYSLEIETQRVWDYAGDGYVHRLIQSKSEGLVQLPAPTESPLASRVATTSSNVRRMGLDTFADDPLITQQDSIVAEKVDSLGMDYARLLHSQLATQRHYYENQIRKLEAASSDQIARLLQDNDSLQQSHHALEQETFKQFNAIKAAAEASEKVSRKCDKSFAKLEVLSKECSEERALNQNLRSNQELLLEKLQDKDSLLVMRDGDIAELKEQVRDLMFFLETQSKVESGEISSELRDSSVIGVAPTPTPKKYRKGKKN